MNVWSIHNASNKNYHLPTSNGLIIYDGYDFGPANCSDMLMSSVFNLVEDYTGNVYCVNLSGQKFKSGTVGVSRFTVLDSLTSADISIIAYFGIVPKNSATKFSFLKALVCFLNVIFGVPP